MKKIILFVLIVIVVLLVGYVLLTKSSQKGVSSSLRTPASTPNDQTPDASNSAADTKALFADGGSYGDEKGEYVITYPKSYQLDVPEGGQYARIFKRGDTDRPQSEMTDGVLITLEAVDLQGKTLEQWVDDQIKQATADGTAELTNPKMPVTQNGYPGFSYSVRGLGESTYLVLQKNNDSTTAVSIVYSIQDPNNKGYDQEVSSILSTLELEK